MKSLDDIKKIKRDADEKLLSIPGVHSLAIGRKIKDGKQTDEIAIRVYVKKKKEKREISDNQVIPENINGVSTDVIEQISHEGTAQSGHDTTQYPELRVGVNLGCHIGTRYEAGTLTAIVFDKNNQFMALSARHVLSASRHWIKGDPIFHIAESQNIVASLYDAELYEVDSTRYPIDAAVATINDPTKIKCQIVDLGWSISGTMHEDELHNKFAEEKKIHVQKRGITTGITSGTIEEINAGPRTMNYPTLGDNPPTKVTFPTNSLIQIASDSGGNFSEGGDSGSLIVDDSKMAVGSLIGGIDGTNKSVANHIDPICKRFGVEIWVG